MFNILYSTIEVDAFTAKIFDIYEKTRNEGLAQVSCTCDECCMYHDCKIHMSKEIKHLNPYEP